MCECCLNEKKSVLQEPDTRVLCSRASPKRMLYTCVKQECPTRPLMKRVAQECQAIVVSQNSVTQKSVEQSCPESHTKSKSFNHDCPVSRAYSLKIVLHSCSWVLPCAYGVRPKVYNQTNIKDGSKVAYDSNL